MLDNHWKPENAGHRFRSSANLLRSVHPRPHHQESNPGLLVSRENT